MKHRRISLQTSGQIARARTELTVASDRLSCIPEEIGQMRRELAEVLDKYMELDKDLFEVRLEIARKNDRGVKDAKTIQIK